MHTHDDADTHLSSSILHGNFNNNCNSGKIHTSKSSQFDDPPRKRFKIATGCPKGNIEVTLEGKTLWDEFCHRGTEMIVNRAGRYGYSCDYLCICLLIPIFKADVSWIFCGYWLSQTES